MSIVLKLSLSGELAASLDDARGLHSRQEFVVNAIVAALHGSCAERELRAEIERLHETLRRVAAAPAPATITTDILSWD